MISKPLIKPRHRWFIWAIVSLFVSGMSLVSYIVISDIEQDTVLTNSEVVQSVRR